MGLARSLLHELKCRFHGAYDAWQDKRLAIDASGRLNKDELESSGPNAGHSYVYLGTPHLVLSLAFRRLGIDPRRFTFVDLGSGKGRVVVRAAERRFKRVEGVELSPLLHRAALENVERANAAAAGALRSPVTVRNEDVLDYDLPQTPLVLFFFNGFERVVLAKFIENLAQSLRDSPRECYFIYLNPRNGDCVEGHASMSEAPATGLARLMIRLLSPWPMAIYRSPSRGAGVASPDARIAPSEFRPAA